MYGGHDEPDSGSGVHGANGESDDRSHHCADDGTNDVTSIQGADDFSDDGTDDIASVESTDTFANLRPHAGANEAPLL